MANMIARLGVVLGLDSAEFTKGVESAQRKLDQFAEAAQTYGRVAAAALVAASAAALKYADEIADVAKANDVAIDSVVKLSNALALAGGKSEDAGKLLAGFTNFVDKAADGSLEAQRSFEKIGIGLKELGTLSSEELLNKTLKALIEIEDPITRNAKAMEIFGKAAKGVDMRELVAQIEETESLSEKQADAIQKAADAFDELTKSAQQTKMILAVELGPPLKATIDYFKEMKSEGDFLASAFKVVFQTIAVLAANVAFVIRTLVLDIVALGKAAKSLLTGDFDEIGNIYREAVSRAERDRMALDQYERRIMGEGDGRRGMDDPRITSSVPALQQAVRQVRKAINPEDEKRRREEEKRQRELQKHFEFVRRKQAEGLEMLERQNREAAEYNVKIEKNGLLLKAAQDSEAARINLARQLLEIEANKERLLPAEVEYRKELLVLQFEHDLEMRRINDAEINDEDRKLAFLREQENYLARIALAYQKMNDITAKQQGTLEEGFLQRMSDFFRDMPTQLEIGAQVFDTVVGNMEAALNRFVQTGKLSFKDFARSIISDLLAIQMRAQLIGLFKGMFGGDDLVVSTQGFVGIGNMSGKRASGGSITNNTPYLVGERGPEIFVPRMSGTVLPNNQVSSMLGGVTNITNNYIDAIDVQSFEQRLLGSSNTVWAANQYAQKSLATGRGRT